MEDIRIGRESTAAEHFVLLAAGTAALLIPADSSRISMTICGGTFSNIWLSFGNAPAANKGLLLPFGTLPLSLNIHDHGDIVRRAIYGLSDNSGEGITIWTASLAK